MANRYWVGGTASWDATAGSKWATTSGGAGGAAAPTAADDVFMDAASGVVTVTTSGTGGVSVCRSLTCTGFAGTLSLPGISATLTIGDASGGALVLSAGITLTVAATASTQLTFVSTSSNGVSGWGIITAGKTMPGMSFNGAGGKWVLQDALVATAGNATVTLTAGTLDTNSQSITCGAFSSSNSNVRTLTLGSSSVAITGVNTSWNMTTNTNMTLNAGTSTITLSGANAAMATGSTSTNWSSIIFSGTGIASITGNPSFTNFNRTGTAAKTDSLSLGTSITVSGTFTVNSNSSINRVLVQAAVVGTARTISAANVVISNIVDFMDITGAGAAPWTVAGTGATALGDCGGNSGITFTTPATQTHTASAGGNWSDATKWTSRVPLPQDNVVVDVNTTGTLTADMPRLGADLNFTGFTGTWSNGTLGTTSYGSLNFSVGMTVSGGQVFTLAGRGTHTITSNGKNAGVTATWAITGAVGGTYTLQDAFTHGGPISVNDGTFTTNNNSVTCSSLSTGSGRPTTINLGTSTVTLTSTAVITVWNTGNNSVTLSGASATLVVANASANARTVNLNVTQVIGTLTYTVANSPGQLILTVGTAGVASTITTLNVGSGRLVTVASGKTLNVTNWNVNGVNNGYLYLPGIASNDATTPDSAALSITGDQEFVFRASVDAFTTGQYIAAKWSGAVGGLTWRIGLSTGALIWGDSTDGTNSSYSGTTLVSAANLSAVLTPGVTYWWRITVDVDNGSGKREIRAYWASDASSEPAVWTAFTGGVINSAAAATLFDGNGSVEVGSVSGGTQPLAGRMYRFIQRSGLSGGSTQFDADFTTHNVGSGNWSNATKTQFTEASVNAATVSINGSLAQVGDGRVALTSSTPGSAATVSSSGNQTSDYLTIQDSTAQGANWYAGLHSVDNGNNKGWIFGTLTPPSTKGNFTLFGGPN